MHAGASLEMVNPQAVLMVKQAILENKPIAVQHAFEQGRLSQKQVLHFQRLYPEDQEAVLNSHHVACLRNGDTRYGGRHVEHGTFLQRWHEFTAELSPRNQRNP